MVTGTENILNQSIDLNCDLGEGSTLLDCDRDNQLMPYLTSCNIACGGHAGNNQVIIDSIKNAKHHNLCIGAHPGYPDKENFGRVTLELPIEELVASVDEQLNRFLRHVDSLKTQCSHVKFHGALYNDLEHKIDLRDALIILLKDKYSSLKVYGLSGGKFEQACEQENIDFVPEGFIDRTYQSNGLLTPRSQTGSLISDPQLAAQQAEQIATGQNVLCTKGSPIRIKAQTLCIHGDGKNALEILRAVFKALEDAKVGIAGIE